MECVVPAVTHWTRTAKGWVESLVRERFRQLNEQRDVRLIERRDRMEAALGLSHVFRAGRSFLRKGTEPCGWSKASLS